MLDSFLSVSLWLLVLWVSGLEAEEQALWTLRGIVDPANGSDYRQ